MIESRNMVERRRLFQVLLLALGLPQAAAGLWALISPRGWYDDFPGFGRAWVSPHGPYNDHFANDVGAGLLALAVLLIAAAIRPERRLVRVSLVTWLVFAIPHLIFHASTTERLETSDNIVNLALLVGAVVVPIFLLALSGRRRRGLAH
jgi:hypothetical protein